jgi:hypothetical protein
MSGAYSGMSDVSGPHDDLTERLSALGRQPLDPSLASAHLTAMAGVAHAGSAWNSVTRRLAIGFAFVVGLLVGTTGLATAGVLGPLQPIVAKGVEATMPLEVPKGPADKADKAEKSKAEADEADKVEKADASEPKTSVDGVHGTERVTEGCVPAANGEFAINRGQYLKQEAAKGDDALAAAKASDCGKPLSSTTDSDETTDADDAKPTESDDRGQPAETGKPDNERTPDGAGEPDGPGKAEGVGSSGQRGKSDSAPGAVKNGK